jgi:energy-coupling factor transport system permease protein
VSQDTFASYHPVVNLLYFAQVLAGAMFLLHPACLLIAAACSFTYALNLNGKKAWRFTLVFILPMMLLTIIINPLYNRQGATILAYFRDGNPLTLEAIVFGLAAGLMLAAVVSWFSCFNIVMTSDKLAYLFGRLLPALSLVFTMTPRFVPRFRQQLKVIAGAQKCLGRDVTGGNLLSRARQAGRILSIMVTWILENAVETADSMRSRGHGLPGRTAFSLYRFDDRDRAALLFLTCTGLFLLIGYLKGGLYFRFFPAIRAVALSPYSLSLLAVYLLLGLWPVILNIKEERRWKSIKSKI